LTCLYIITHKHRKVSLCLCIVTVAIILGVYVYRMITLYPLQIEPMVYNENCILNKIILLITKNAYE
jgi:hypothetical protein